MTWAEEFEATHKDINSVARITKEILQQGKDLAFNEYHNAKSIERLKEKIKGMD